MQITLHIIFLFWDSVYDYGYLYKTRFLILFHLEEFCIWSHMSQLSPHNDYFHVQSLCLPAVVVIWPVTSIKGKILVEHFLHLIPTLLLWYFLLLLFFFDVGRGVGGISKRGEDGLKTQDKKLLVPCEKTIVHLAVVFLFFLNSSIQNLFTNCSVILFCFLAFSAGIALGDYTFSIN